MIQPSERYGGSNTQRGRKRPKVVVDTGVLVSAFAFGGVPADALRSVLRTADLFVSPDLLAEYREVPDQLRSTGKITAVQRQALVSGIAALVAEARVVVPTRQLAICRDPADNMVVECCFAARASLLITGDRDLLDLAPMVPQMAGLRQLAILTPRAFFERLAPSSAKKR